MARNVKMGPVISLRLPLATHELLVEQAGELTPALKARELLTTALTGAPNEEAATALAWWKAERNISTGFVSEHDESPVIGASRA